MRAPGGGRKAKIYNTVAARLLSAFYQENKGRTLSVALMQEILNLMRTAHIVPTDVPKTVYHLVESGKLFLPKKEPTKLILSTGEVYYYPPETIVQEVLKSPNDTLGWKYKYDERYGPSPFISSLQVTKRTLVPHKAGSTTKMNIE